MKTKEEILINVYGCSNLKDFKKSFNSVFISLSMIKEAMEAYAKEYHENEMKKLRRKEGRIINAYKKGYSDGQWSRDLAIRVQAK